jgi:hypothetical protein
MPRLARQRLDIDPHRQDAGIEREDGGERDQPAHAQPPGRLIRIDRQHR